MLEEELGATHKEVSLISHRVISVKVLSFVSFHLKKYEGCSGGHQMLIIFLIEDPPTWVILMTSKLDLWLRAAGSLKYPFVQKKTNSDFNHLVVFRMDSITMYFLFMSCFLF